jgi:DNA-binding transcriptional MerR regulator
MVEPQVLECLETAVVCKLARVNRSTLDYWLRTGLIRATIRTEPGRRRTRLWTVQDAVVVRTVAELRASGCSLQKIKKACQELENRWDALSSKATLFWDGGDVVSLDEEGRAESLLQQPHQQLLRLTELPISRWRTATASEVKYIHVDNLPLGVPADSPEHALKAALG